MSQTPTPIPPFPAAPPTVPGMLSVPDRPAAWPSVVGVLCMVFGGLGVLGGVWGAASNIMMLLGTMPVQPMGGGPTNIDLLPTFRTMAPLVIGGEALKVVLSVALILVGVAIHKRKPIARPAAVWWSIAKIVLSIAVAAVTAWVQYEIMSEVIDAMSQDPNVPAQMKGVMSGVMAGAIGMAVLFGIAWGGALPIFLLIWFTRARVRAEVQRWAERGHRWVS